MHIILRFELEQELIDGTLSTADVPGGVERAVRGASAWPCPDDRRRRPAGRPLVVGLFGYFPTYQLGNVMSIQIGRRQAALPDLEEQFALGRFLRARHWLREYLHAPGAS